MSSTAQALNWNTAPQTFDRYNNPTQPYESTTFGFKGFPEMNMFKPKHPMVQRRSADVHQDVNRYFRKESPVGWNGQSDNRPPRQPSPPPPARQDLSQQERLSPGPGALHGTISPRYQDEGSSRKPPVIRDPFNQLTSAERERKINEAYIAEQDLAAAARRREQQKFEKMEEQKKPRFDDGSPTRMDMGQGPYREERLGQQESQMRKMKEELDWLKSQDDMNNRHAMRDRDFNGRAQSEPQTDRPRRNMDHDDLIWQHDFNKPSPRKPIGRMYNVDSTYQNDFIEPTYQTRPNVLGNPKQEPSQPMYNPFSRPGGGAPLYNPQGQRFTRIQGSLGNLGREFSLSARANRAKKSEYRQDISKQRDEQERNKREERERERQAVGELATVIRHTNNKVGYPNIKETGAIGNHHLSHAISRPEAHEYSYLDPAQKWQKQKNYHQDLTYQVAEQKMNRELGQMEEHRQSKQHFQTSDGYYHKFGGGNMKGENLRKVNLMQAIHNPQNTMIY